MTKNVTNRPGAPPSVVRPPTAGTATPLSSTKKPTASDKLKDKKVAQRSERAPIQRQQRQPRAAGAAAHGTAGAHGAVGEDHGEDGGLVSGGVGAADGVDDLHRRRHGDADALWETQREENFEHVDEVHESAATGADAIKRSGGGREQGSSDGFDQGQRQREAYERLLRGNVKNDEERFAELRKRGRKDDFRPDATAPEVEKNGTNRIVAHVVRLYDSWTLDGVKRDEAVPRMAAWLSQLSSPQVIRKVLQELESKPIRDVYPLELLLHLLEHRPELLPGVKKGAVLGAADELASGRKVFAGHPVQVPVPPDMRIKSFALLGGGRPGYEFFPTPGDDARYTLLIDTPGRWTFALLAVPLVSLGRIQKESQEAVLELFRVTVSAMGRKGEPISPEDWWAQEQAEAGGDDDADDGEEAEAVDVRAAPAPAAEPAPLLIQQIRRALDAIVRDENTGPGAQTYSWDVRLYRPGAAVDGEGVLHLVVERAGPFDPVWAKAREAINQKQREFEPGRALLTQEDLAAALRRARVR